LDRDSASAERAGGWVHLKGADSMATSRLIYRNDLVETGRAISGMGFGTWISFVDFILCFVFTQM